MSTPIVIAADDYGLSPGVSAGIRDLIRQGRVTATGCMVLWPDWPEAAAELRPLADQADVGLHLQLTDGGRFPTIGGLMDQAFTGRLDGQVLRQEIHRQLDLFEAGMGRPPAFLDGHHHVHQLPVIRPAVLDILSSRYGVGERPWLRHCGAAPVRTLRRGVAVPKALLLTALGLGLRRQASDRGIRTNPDFTGVYDFAGPAPYARLADRFARGLHAGAVWMVHPGQPCTILPTRDGMVQRRAEELAYLAGEGFARLLAERRLAPARLSAAMGL